MLPRVQAPTLVMHACNDAVHPVEQGRIIAANIPNAEFVELNSNNHTYLSSDPAWHVFVDQILAYVSREP